MRAAWTKRRPKQCSCESESEGKVDDEDLEVLLQRGSGQVNMHRPADGTASLDERMRLRRAAAGQSSGGGR